MTFEDAHRAVDRMIDLVTRESVTAEERAELIALLKFLRRERKSFGRKIQTAQTIAFEEGLDFRELATRHEGSSAPRSN